MGIILAKFRKEKTTYQILEKLEEEIQGIEQYSVSTQARQKRYVGNFLVISIGLYVIGFIVFYFVFFPPTWSERITYSVPLLIFPLLIFLIKRVVAWYFQRKLNKNSNKLSTLRAKKKKVIEQVMDKETYKVAVDILNKFGNKTTDLKSPMSLQPRSPFSSPAPSNIREPMSAQRPTKPLGNELAIPQKLGEVVPKNRLQPINVEPSKMSPLSPAPLSGTGSQRFQYRRLQKLPTPYPIINQQEKGVLEKMVDYLIGDGPQNRFAMICRDCLSHNGMALQEEYEYASFRCAFCGSLNPSRKLRPIAPKLPSISPTKLIGSNAIKSGGEDGSSSSTSTSEKDSGSDSDDADKSTKELTNSETTQALQQNEEKSDPETDQLLQTEKTEDHKKID